MAQQFEHWRSCLPCSPLSDVGLVKAIATLQRKLFTASCFSPNADLNWGISASHPPKAFLPFPHPMQVDTVPTKTDAAVKQNDGVFGAYLALVPLPLPPGSPSMVFSISRSSWSPPFSRVIILLGLFLPWAALGRWGFQSSLAFFLSSPCSLEYINCIFYCAMEGTGRCQLTNFGFHQHS